MIEINNPENTATALEVETNSLLCDIAKYMNELHVHISGEKTQNKIWMPDVPQSYMDNVIQNNKLVKQIFDSLYKLIDIIK